MMMFKKNIPYFSAIKRGNILLRFDSDIALIRRSLFPFLLLTVLETSESILLGVVVRESYSSTLIEYGTRLSNGERYEVVCRVLSKVFR